MSPLARICGTCGTLIQQGEHHRHTTPSEQRKATRPNYRQVYNTPRWRALRAATLTQAGHACAVCGHGSAEGIKLTVHHLEPFDGAEDPKAWDPQNLVVLCDHDHGKQHGGAH